MAARGGGSRGGCGSGGRSQRGASPPDDAAKKKSQVRACDMRAKCQHSVLRSVLRSVGRGQDRTEREGPGVCLRHACDMPTKCPAKCTAECRGGKGQGREGEVGREKRAAGCGPVRTEPGRQGAARCRGSGRGASRIAPRSVSREGEERTGTGTPRNRDQGTWERRHERTREGEQTGGRTGPRSQGRGRVQRGSAATRIAPHCARAGRRAEGQRRQGRAGGVPRRHERASVGRKRKGAHRRASRPQCAVALDKAGRRGALPRSGPPRVESHDEGQVRACDVHATCLHSVLRSVQRGDEGGKGGAGREGPEANLRHACDMPAKCPAWGQKVRIERGKGRGGRGR